MKTYTYSELGNYGALGNQLFQIAGVIGEGLRSECRIKFPADWYYRKFFNIYDGFFGECDLNSASTIDFYPDYMQDLKHFKYYESAIREYFSPSGYGQTIIKNRIDPNSTGVHVRRGNNLKLSNHHPSPSLDYFEKALSEINPTGDIVVFSDDLNWCKKQSLFQDCLFGVGVPDEIDVMELTTINPKQIDEAVIDLLLLSQCNNHIISNSSFSWWGAWLADGERVIYPEEWYGPALSHVDISNLFPENWEKLGGTQNVKKS